MERLTEKELKDGWIVYNRTKYAYETTRFNSSPIRKIIGKLKEYEDLEEQGKLLKLPCAVGDTVYEVQAIRERIQPYTVREIHISNFENQYSWELKDGKGFYSNVDGFSESDIGDSVFLTMEEAEAELACSIPSQKQQCEECICNSCFYKEDCCSDCEGAIFGCEEYLEADGDSEDE